MGGTNEPEGSWREELAGKLSLATMIAFSFATLASYLVHKQEQVAACDLERRSLRIREGELTRHGIEQGHDRVLAKPFEPSRLLETLDELRAPARRQGSLQPMA